MSDLINRLEILRRDTMEQAVIDSIPKNLLDNLNKANEEFAAKGGCPGCGSQRIGVHASPCSVCDNDLY